MQNLIRNIQMFAQVSRGKDNNPEEKVYFLGRYNKPPATPAAALSF